MTPVKFTPQRMQRVGMALLLGLVVGAAIYVAAGKREHSSFFRGDFPAFYAAAEIVWSGEGERLYDYDLQRTIENQHWPEFNGAFYIYPYPPFFALLLSPLAFFSPLIAKFFASGLLFGALAVAIFLVRRESEFFKATPLFAFGYLLSFLPLGISVAGVQNTALSILCFSLVYWGIKNGRAFLVGFSAALLLYKPQFGALLFLFLLARGQKGEIVGWCFGAVGLYILGLPVLGVEWPFVWLSEAMKFGDINFTINDHEMISLAGLTYWFVEKFFGKGASALPWAYGASALVLALQWIRIRQNPKHFAYAPLLVLFLSPQTLFYDLGIAVFWVMVFLRPYHNRDLVLLAGLWGYGALAFVLRDLTSFPLFVLPLLLLFGVMQGRDDWSTIPGKAFDE